MTQQTQETKLIPMSRETADKILTSRGEPLNILEKSSDCLVFASALYACTRFTSLRLVPHIIDPAPDYLSALQQMHTLENLTFVVPTYAKKDLNRNIEPFQLDKLKLKRFRLLGASIQVIPEQACDLDAEYLDFSHEPNMMSLKGIDSKAFFEKLNRANSSKIKCIDFSNNANFFEVEASDGGYIMLMDLMANINARLGIVFNLEGCYPKSHYGRHYPDPTRVALKAAFKQYQDNKTLSPLNKLVDEYESLLKQRQVMESKIVSGLGQFFVNQMTTRIGEIERHMAELNGRAHGDPGIYFYLGKFNEVKNKNVEAYNFYLQIPKDSQYYGPAHARVFSLVNEDKLAAGTVLETESKPARQLNSGLQKILALIKCKEKAQSPIVVSVDEMEALSKTINSAVTLHFGIQLPPETQFGANLTTLAVLLEMLKPNAPAANPLVEDKASNDENDFDYKPLLLGSH